MFRNHLALFFLFLLKRFEKFLKCPLFDSSPKFETSIKLELMIKFEEKEITQSVIINTVTNITS